MELKRKEKSKGISPDILVAVTESEQQFIRALNEGIEFKKKKYDTEAWLYRPLQCMKCTQFGHKAIECKHHTQVCFKCGAEGHKRDECKRTVREYKCTHCGKKHNCDSRSCPVTQKEYRKCNREYATILKNHGIVDENFEKMFINEQIDDENETDEEVFTNRKMITEMINAIAIQVDEIEGRVDGHDNDIAELNEVVACHEEEILENKMRIEDIEVASVAHGLYIAENFESMREFMKTFNKEAVWKNTKTMEEQREMAKNRVIQSKEKETGSVSNKPVVERREENDKNKSKLMSRMKEIRKRRGEGEEKKRLNTERGLRVYK